MTVQLIAKSRVVYGGVPRNPGEQFEASEQDAFILSGLGAVDRDTTPVPTPDIAGDAPRARPTRATRRRDLKAGDSAAANDPKPKRSYQRRDLVAEGDE